MSRLRKFLESINKKGNRISKEVTTTRYPISQDINTRKCLCLYYITNIPTFSSVI